MKKKPMKNYGVRADECQMALASVLEIDVGALFRKALSKELMRRKGRCPNCGQEVKRVK